MAESMDENTMENPSDPNDPWSIQHTPEQRPDNSEGSATATATTAAAAAATSLTSPKTPPPLKELACSTLRMDSDTDFSDVEWNTFARRALYSPRIGVKKDSGAKPKQNEPQTWLLEPDKNDHSLKKRVERNSHLSTAVSSEASSCDSNSNTDTDAGSDTSPIKSGISGKYEKILLESSTANSCSTGSVDELVLNRLPGENLGLIFAVEGERYSSEPIKSVVVKDVAEDSVAFRKGIRVGDSILEINGIVLHNLTHDECVSVIQEMPLQIMLNIKRVKQQQKQQPRLQQQLQLTFKQKMQAREKKLTAQWEKQFDYSGCLGDTKVDRADTNGIRSPVSNSDADDSDCEEGYTIHEVTLQKNASENLGLSVVPSYGATRHLYQIKRLLPSGIGSRSGKLKVGDRLLSCNGHSLKRVTQAHCLNILKSAGERVTLKILRQVQNESSMEISVTQTVSSNVKKTSQVLNSYPASSDKNSSTSNSSKVTSRLTASPSSLLTSDTDSLSDIDMSSTTNETRDLLDGDNDVNILSYEELNTTQSNNAGESFEQTLFDSHIEDNSSAGSRHFKRSSVDGQRYIDSNEGQEFDSAYQTADSSQEPTGSPSRKGNAGIPPPTQFADNPLKSGERVREEMSLKFDESVVPVTNIDDLLGESPEFVSEQESESDMSNTEEKEKEKEQKMEINGNNKDHLKKSLISEQTCDLLLDISYSVSSNSIPDVAQKRKEETSVMEQMQYEHNENTNDYFSVENNNNNGDILELENINFETSEPATADLLGFDGDNNQNNDANTTGFTRIMSDQILDGIGVKEHEKNVLEFNSEKSEKEKIPDVKANNENSSNYEDSQMNMVSEGNNVTQVGVTSPDNEFISPGNVTLIPVETDDDTTQSDMTFVTVTSVNTQPSITKVIVSNSAADSSARRQFGVSTDIPGPVVISLDDSTCDSDQTTKISVNGSNIPLESHAMKPRASRRKILNANTSPIHIPVPSMPDSERNADGEEIITPLCMKTDEKGVRVFQQGTQHQTGSSPAKKVDDETAKRDLAAILLDLSKSSLMSGRETEEEVSVVEEDKVVPEVISRKDANILMNIFQKWLQGGSEKESSPFKKLVSGVINAESKDVTSVHTEKKDVHTETNAVSSGGDQRKESLVIEKTSGVNGHIVSTVTEGDGDGFIHKTFVNVRDKPSGDVKHQTLLNVTKRLSGDSLLNKPATATRIDASPDNKSPQGREATPTKRETILQGRQTPETINKPTVGARISSPPSQESSSSKFAISPLTKIVPVRLSSQSLSSSGRTFGPSRIQLSTKSTKAEYPRARQEDGPFQVDVLKGIVGLGIKIKVSEDGFARVTEIQSNSPVARNGHVKVGDIVLSINNTNLTGQSDGKVQQVLRLLPRGLAKIVISAVPPSGDLKQDSSSDQSDLDEMSYYPGRTSPFGVRLGAKPFNAAESKSVTVTSPLSKDTPFFKLGDKKVATSPVPKEETKSPKIKDEVTQALFQGTKPSSLQDNDQLENTKDKDVNRSENISASLEKEASLELDTTDYKTLNATPVSIITQVKPPVPKGRKTVHQTKSDLSVNEGELTNTDKKRNKETEDEAVEEIDKTKEDKEKDVIVSTSKEIITENETAIKAEPCEATKSEPKIFNDQCKTAEKTLSETKTEKYSTEPDGVFIESPKVIPPVPPKPKGRKSLQEHRTDQPVNEETSAVKKSHTFSHSSDMDPIVEVSTNGKVFTEVRIPAALKPRVHAETKVPPAVPPKPCRKSSASSDISVSSVKSDASHSSEEGKIELRNRSFSNRSDASFTLENVKAELRPRRYSSSSSSSSRFEDATSDDETNNIRMQERLGKFEDPQGAESYSLKSRPGKKRRHSVKEHMAMFESMQKHEEVSSRKENSQADERDKNQEEKADLKLNAALSPRFRGLHSGTYTKSVPERTSTFSAVPVSLTKPTTLSKLKGLVIPNSSNDSGAVAHSSSPEGRYTKTSSANLNSAPTRKTSKEEILSTKMNPALAPKKVSKEEIKIFTAKPFKAYASGERGTGSSGLSGKIDVNVSMPAQNNHSDISSVKTLADQNEQSPIFSSHTLSDSESTKSDLVTEISDEQKKDAAMVEDGQSVAKDLETLMHMGQSDTANVSDASFDSADTGVKVEMQHNASQDEVEAENSRMVEVVSLGSEIVEDLTKHIQQESDSDKYLLEQFSRKEEDKNVPFDAADLLENLSAEVKADQGMEKHHVLEMITDAEPEADNVIDEVGMPLESVSADDSLMDKEPESKDNNISEDTKMLLLDLTEETKETKSTAEGIEIKSKDKKAESSPLLMFLSGMETVASEEMSSKSAFFDDSIDVKETADILDTLSQEVTKESENIPTIDHNDPHLKASVSKLVDETIEAAMEELSQNCRSNQVGMAPNDDLKEQNATEEDDTSPPPPLPGSAPPPLPTSKPPSSVQEKQVGISAVDIAQTAEHKNDDDQQIPEETVAKSEDLCSVDVIDETLMKTERKQSMSEKQKGYSSHIDDLQTHDLPKHIPQGSDKQLDIDTTLPTQKESTVVASEYSSGVPSQLSPMSQSSDSGVVDIRNTSVDIDAEASETLIDEFDPLSPARDLEKKEFIHTEREPSAEESLAAFNFLNDFDQTRKNETQVQQSGIVDSISGTSESSNEKLSDKLTDECAIMKVDSDADDKSETWPMTTSADIESSNISESNNKEQNIYSSELSKTTVDKTEQDTLENPAVNLSECMTDNMNSMQDKTALSETAQLSYSDISPSSQEAPACIAQSLDAADSISDENINVRKRSASLEQVPTHIIETSVHETLSESHDSNSFFSHAQMTYTDSSGHDVNESKDVVHDDASDDDVLTSKDTDLCHSQASDSKESFAKENGVLQSNADNGVATDLAESQVISGESSDKLSANNNNTSKDVSSAGNINTDVTDTKESTTVSSRRKWKVFWKPDSSAVEEYTSITESAKACAVSPDDLKTSIEFANKMMDKAGQADTDEIKLVVLKKDSGEKAGFEMRDGVAGSKKISKIYENGVADKSGVLCTGDCLWSVCGQSVDNLSTPDLKNLLDNRTILVLALTKGHNLGHKHESLLAKGSNRESSVTKEKSQETLTEKSDRHKRSPAKGDNHERSPAKGDNHERSPAKGDNHESSPAKERPKPVLQPSSDSSDLPLPVELEPGVFDITMQKGVTGVGFCLEGGIGSPRGDLPITIKRIFKGGPADKCGHLKVGDEILKVNELDFTEMRHYEAWNHLKFLPDGVVHLTIRRKTK